MARLKIFISYRRGDLHGLAQGIVGRIHDRLEDHYGEGQVFMDIDAIPPGANFVDYLDAWVGQADVLLAVIGPQWAELLQARRTDPRDFVRIEIESALQRGIPVVPILLRGARMPGPEVLTGGLAGLAERQAVEVDDGRDFKAHAGRLIRDLDLHYRPRKSSAKPPPPSPASPRAKSPPVAPPRPAPEQEPKRAAKPASPPKKQPAAKAQPIPEGLGKGRAKKSRRGCLVAAGAAVAVAVGIGALVFWPRGGSVATYIDIELPAPAPPVKRSEVSLAAAPAPVAASPFPPAQATKERPYQNTLGMRFVPLPGTQILMSVWETRVQDYAAYAASNSGVDAEWRAEAKEPTLPVVNVSWEEAQAFCAWLSKKEGKTYRLPTDHEWSVAVGIGDREDPTASPKDKDGKTPDVYPWGSQWPPPARAGNYGTIEGYADGHSGLAPVGSYTPNGLGIFDLGGNVYEWCEDLWEPGSSSRVLRGASWDARVPDYLLSSCRRNLDPTYRYYDYGFRLVMEGGGER